MDTRNLTEALTLVGEMALAECGVANPDALAVLRLTGIQLADRFRDRWSDRDYLPGDQLQLVNTDDELELIARELIELMPYEWGDSVNSLPIISIRSAMMDDALGLSRSTGEIVVTRDALRGSVAAGLAWRVVQHNSPLADCIDVQRADERDHYRGQPYGPAGRAGLCIGFLLTGDLSLLDMIGTSFTAYQSLSMVAGAWIHACRRQRQSYSLVVLDGLPELGSRRWMDTFDGAMVELSDHPSPKALKLADRLLAQLVPGWQHDSPLELLQLVARGRGIPDTWTEAVVDVLLINRDTADIEGGLSSDTADIVSLTDQLQRLLDEEQRDDDWVVRMRSLVKSAADFLHRIDPHDVDGNCPGTAALSDLYGAVDRGQLAVSLAKNQTGLADEDEEAEG